MIERERPVVPAYQKLQDGIKNFFDKNPGSMSFLLDPAVHGSVHVSFGLACGILGYFPDMIEVNWKPRDPDIFSIKMTGRSELGSVILQSCGESVSVLRTGDAVDRRTDEQHIKRLTSIDVLVDLCVGVMQREREAREKESVVQ